MLKIKDGVDLKELEKFGFKFNNDTGKYVFHINCEFDNGGIEIIVKAWDRMIYVWSNTNSVKDEGLPHVFYNLFQANLIEKVEE